MSTPISDILDKIDQMTQAYTFNGYAALANSVKPSLTLALIVYVAFVGWMTLQGWSEMSVKDYVKHTIKIAMVLTIALNWSLFSELIYDVFMNGPNELSAILMQSAGSSFGSANAALQAAYDQGTAIGEQLYSYHSFSYKLTAIVIWGLNYFVSGVALLELTVAKCGFAVTMVLAPIFAACLLWNGSKGLFDRWLSTSIAFGLVPLLLSAVLLIIDQILQMGLNQINSDIASKHSSIESISTFVLASIASIGLLFKAPSIAANIGGGVSVSAISTAVASAGIADKLSGFKAARGHVAERIKKRLRRDRK